MVHGLRLYVYSEKISVSASTLFIYSYAIHILTKGKNEMILTSSIFKQHNKTKYIRCTSLFLNFVYYSQETITFFLHPCLISRIVYGKVHISLIFLWWLDPHLMSSSRAKMIEFVWGNVMMLKLEKFSCPIQLVCMYSQLN